MATATTAKRATVRKEPVKKSVAKKPRARTLTTKKVESNSGSWFFWLVVVGIILLSLKGCGKSDAESQVETQTKAAQQAENTRKGFHCLSGWDGSHRGVEKYVKANLRDPDSYGHIETRITPVNNKGEHLLVMKYRAKNGFGGMNVESIVATVKNESCKATIM